MPPAQRRVSRPTSVPAQEAPATPQRRMNTANARDRAHRVEQGRATMTTEAYGQETVQEERLEDRVFPPGVEPDFVRVSVGKTINLGNYESLRIDVGVTSACLKSERDETVRELAEYVADKLLSEEAEWMGTAKPKANRR